MSRALFTRKAVDVDELKNRTGEERDKSYYVVEKVIELLAPQFQEFGDNLLQDYDFIEANIDIMYVDADRVWHCLLIKEAGSKTGILVESEGYSYARYASYYEEP
ncbi:MAG TPA: DUF6329 domain-containing protein [Desulfitobacteriaceae bacterium]|nr:DUF6329 domain-containing protein [Desulfitobacteriaceae bacterium]